MNFDESNKIFEKIKKADEILINCHRNPDPDSVGSAVALHNVLINLGKKVKIICPTQVPSYMSFIPGYELVETVDFNSFGFGKYDLFITLDSANLKMVSDTNNFELPDIFVIVIDHHRTNEKYGSYNFVKDGITSTAEILFCLFEDWNILPIAKNTSTCLMAGLLGDTGVFRFPGLTANTFRVASKLLEYGAEKDAITFKTVFSIEPRLIKFWGGLLLNFEVDEKHKFVYMSMDYENFKRFGSPQLGRELAASNFGEVVDGMDFGIVMIEQEKNVLSVSFRSRTGLDTSQIANSLGGGGHVYAAGAKVENLPFKEAVKKVLKAAQSYAKNAKSTKKVVS